MENLVKEVGNFRVFKIKYIGATNTRGSQIEIKESERFFSDKSVKVRLGYCYKTDDTLEQGLQYLKSKGFNIIGRASDKEQYFVFCDNWGIDYKELK